jgi:hypothetical protein
MAEQIGTQKQWPLSEMQNAARITQTDKQAS